MQLSDLDGFLTGIICSPELIPPSKWLPVIWGGEQAGQKNATTAEWAIQEVFTRYNEIVDCLNSEPAFIEPIFWHAKEGHVIAMDWCEGFMDAFNLHPSAWEDLITTNLGKKWIYPIKAHLIDEHGQSLVGAKETEIDALLDRSAKKIPEVVPHIFTYWQSKRSDVN